MDHLGFNCMRIVKNVVYHFLKITQPRKSSEMDQTKVVIIFFSLIQLEELGPRQLKALSRFKNIIFKEDDLPFSKFLKICMFIEAQKSPMFQYFFSLIPFFKFDIVQKIFF